MAENKVYDDTNTGIIGINDYKQKDTHPDVRGRINVGGIWYWLSGWNKQSGNRAFTSLAVTEMTQAEVDTLMEKKAAKQAPQQRQTQQQQAPVQQQAQPQPQQVPPTGDFDDDIPF